MIPKPKTQNPKPSENDAVVFRNVSKFYYLQSQRTLKEFLPAFLRGKQTKKELWALKNVSFKVRRGETLGIVGPNGAGKSTVLKLIAGVTQPSKGKIIVNGKVSPLIELGAGFHPELTGRENIYLNGSILGLKRTEIDKKFKSIVDFAELWDFIDTPIKFYSSGMYMRLGFSIAISVEPEILLIDEILAVGDASFQKKCLEKMNEFKKNKVTIVFVSHNLGAIKDFCQRAIWLERGKIKEEGEPEKVITAYQTSLS